MKIVAITQARLSSTRFPEKVLKPLGEKTVLDLHLKRIRKSRLINQFVVAAATEFGQERIEKVALEQGFDFFAGDVNDVLDRFYQSCKNLKPDYVVRLTSDCPLVDPFYIDDLITRFLAAKVDYAANFINPTLPDGLDAEIFTFKALEEAWKDATKKSEREHVTPYIRESSKFSVLSVDYPLNLGKLRITLDTEKDYQLLSELVAGCGENEGLMTYVDYLHDHPEIVKINSQYERNEGYAKSLQGDSKC